MSQEGSEERVKVLKKIIMNFMVSGLYEEWGNVTEVTEEPM